MDGLAAAKVQLSGGFAVPSRVPAADWWAGLKVLDPANIQALEQALGEIHQAFAVGRGADNSLPAYVPACPLENLGDPTFCAAHGIQVPYVAGAMANGIGSVEVVEALGAAACSVFSAPRAWR